MIDRTFLQIPEQDAAAAEAGVTAHCRRVAGWCEELARVLYLPKEEATALRDAALMHHQPDLLRGPALTRLMGDLGVSTEPDAYAKSSGSSVLSEKILRELRSGKREGVPSSSPANLARILDAVNYFDEQLEFAPFEDDSIGPVLERSLLGRGQFNVEVGFVLKHLRRANRADLEKIKPKLPVYPAIAMKLHRQLSSNEGDLSAVEKIAKADQVLAGRLISAANSVYYSPCQPVKTLSQAIGYIGTEDARRILLASSVQPIFNSPRLRRLWRHALEAAPVAEKIAELSGKIDPAEAFLLGLLHDVGKLAISLLSKDVNDAMERLIGKSCAPTVAEVVLCGFDHAEAGSEVMKYWKFSEEMTSAVRYHHEPERSGSIMAALLYLTEFWIDSEEDLPSKLRLNTAMQMLGVTPQTLENARLGLNTPLADL